MNGYEVTGKIVYLDRDGAGIEHAYTETQMKPIAKTAIEIWRGMVK